MEDPFQPRRILSLTDCIEVNLYISGSIEFLLERKSQSRFQTVKIVHFAPANHLLQIWDRKDLFREEFLKVIHEESQLLMSYDPRKGTTTILLCKIPMVTLKKEGDNIGIIS